MAVEQTSSPRDDIQRRDETPSVINAGDSGRFAAIQLVAALTVFGVATWAIAGGAHLGLFGVRTGSVLIVLVAMLGGSVFVLRVTRHLRRIDAERAAGQEQLRQSQERLDFALRGAELASWDWNIESGDIVFNDRWSEMRGYRSDELPARFDQFISGLHPDDRPRVQEVLEAYLRGDSDEYESEHRIQTKTGEWIWLHGRGKVFARDEDGRPVRMVGVSRDVSKRKRLEAELRLAEARSSGILATSSDAIISVDGEQRIMSFNEGAATIFGYAKSEVIGEPLDILIPDAFRSSHREHIERFTTGPSAARRMGKPVMAIVGRRKNGDVFPAEASISKLDVGGTQILTVSLRDATEQQRRESEKTLLAEAGTILSASIDHEGMLPRIAQAAARSFADLCIVELMEDGALRRLAAITRDPAHTWVCDTLMDTPAMASLEFIGPALSARRTHAVDSLAAASLASTADSATQRRLHDAIGTTSAIAVPLMARERILGAIVLLRTSASKSFDAHDVRLAEDLAERTAVAIENGQLFRAAQLAIRARDEVLGVVAHDLRNPLGTILIEAAYLRRVQSRGGAAESTGNIERAATRMNRLIQDLIDVTRMDAGPLPLHDERLDTGRLLSDVIELQIPLVSSCGLELVLAAPRELPHVNGDRDRLLQVFENLIGNALKFTEPGGRITIAATTRGDTGDVLFSVSDTGTGVNAQDIPHLFDRFWQARERERRGAGLGLPIAKGIVEAHGGRIWVDSVPHSGSTFLFTLPALPMAEVKRAEPTLRKRTSGEEALRI